MNHTKVAIAIVAVLIGGAALGYWIAHQRMGSGSTEATSAEGGRKVLYWYDPMVPNAKFDKPGKSPFMDMQLVPKYAGEEGGAAVRVSSTVTQNLGIRLGTVEKTVLQPRLGAVGSVAFDERVLEVVQARVEGYVTKLHVKAPLEHVRRGQPLADIVAPQWLEAQQEYLALLDAQSGRGQSIRDAARQRLIVLGVPESTIRDLESQRKTNASTTLVAPIDGVVTELSVREGAAFMAGAPLFRINGLKTVWVNAQVPEAQVSMIPMGSTVEAHATAWPGMTFKGRVAALLPEVDPQTRTIPVRIAVDNPDAKLSPGMFVTVDLAGKQGEEHLVVPSEAVIMTGERNVVIVAREGGGFDVANVTVGTEEEGKTAILSGLQEGQSIVLSGQFLIDSEASLGSTVSRLSAATAAAGAQDGAPEDSRPLHLTEGTIKEITPEAITIAHGPVPSLKWDAMTMSFKPPAKGLPSGLKVGDHVSFSFDEAEQGGFQIDSIVILDEQTPAAESKP
jgi:Cu(I)/Ag(I) efflux system membrane fusion protein